MHFIKIRSNYSQLVDGIDVWLLWGTLPALIKPPRVISSRNLAGEGGAERGTKSGHMYL